MSPATLKKKGASGSLLFKKEMRRARRRFSKNAAAGLKFSAALTSEEERMKERTMDAGKTSMGGALFSLPVQRRFWTEPENLSFFTVHEGTKAMMHVPGCGTAFCSVEPASRQTRHVRRLRSRPWNSGRIFCRDLNRACEERRRLSGPLSDCRVAPRNAEKKMRACGCEGGCRPPCGCFECNSDLLKKRLSAVHGESFFFEKIDEGSAAPFRHFAISPMVTGTGTSCSVRGETGRLHMRLWRSLCSVSVSRR